MLDPILSLNIINGIEITKTVNTGLVKVILSMGSLSSF
jgi:hypothetical protein